jgi:uncharacterized protein YprB with RNaseH-like and TPR domain
MRALRDRLLSYKKEFRPSNPSVPSESESPCAEDEEQTASTDEAQAISPPETALETVIPGQEEITPFGPCYYREMRFDVLTLHGHDPLVCTRQLPLEPLLKVCRTKTDLQGWEEACFFDTETTGLGSGAGTFIFLYGVGFFEEDEFVIRQYFLRSHTEERALLWSLCRLFENFRAIISFNGKGYDWKLFETRCVLARQAMPDVIHLDLLPPSRRLWKKILSNCKLSTLEQEVLGFSRLDDLPGREAPGIYFAFQADGDARPLLAVFRHNMYDVLTLVTLAAQIAGRVEDPLHTASHPEELFGLARWYEEWMQGKESEACLMQVARMEEQADYAREAVWKLSLFYKRQGQYEKAVALWRELLEGGGMWQTASRIELAKYYEHRVKDYRTALRFTEETIALLLQKRALIRALRIEHELKELYHRQNRLQHKLNKDV